MSGFQKAARATSNVVSLSKKYTLEASGFWNRFRRLLAIDPERSSGVPLNSHYRFPAPGSLDPMSYTDPVTTPAGDLADNPYWKRDVRRMFPRPSTVTQSDAVALLTVGSKAQPKDDVLQIGEAGAKQLVAVKQEGEEHGLAAYFVRDNKGILSVLDENGFPPKPCNINPTSTKYKLDDDHGYPEKYPCRVFV